MESDVNAVFAIYLPQTGIINSHELMSSFQRIGASRNVMYAYNTECSEIHQETDGYVVGFKGDDFSIKTRVLINCAGLCSDRIPSMVGINLPEYRLYPCKGSYFSYGKRSPIKRLVYPVPHQNLTGLGVHATLDLGGRLRFGPDTEYGQNLNYDVDKYKQDNFYNAACKIIKNIEKDSFAPDMAGIRPKLSGPNDPVRDFIIKEESIAGCRGFINLIGIESPGLTSCISIANMVAEMVDQSKCL
jgi:L-2-hydroxyglutarate oxidase LhgO